MSRFDICLTAVVTLIFLLLGTAGHAKQLLEVDGIVLSGTERLVARGAGTCQVLEGHHSVDVYEQMQANHGQPLDVWQLDFSVHNGTGKRLDHVIARFSIAAEWPPCTRGKGLRGAMPSRWSGPTPWDISNRAVPPGSWPQARPSRPRSSSSSFTKTGLGFVTGPLITPSPLRPNNHPRRPLQVNNPCAPQAIIRPAV